MAINTDAAISQAEQAGLKLAVTGRIFAALPFLAWFSVMGNYPAIFLGLGALAGLMSLGVLHYWLIQTGLERRWLASCLRQSMLQPSA